LREVVEAKDTEVVLLRAQVEALAAQLAELRARLGQNSRNSSRPPSSDGPGKPAQGSLRGKSGRKPGRPKGHPGATLEFMAADEVVVHEPGQCAGCGKDLTGAPATGVIRRQVTDVPPVRPVVTEHQMIARRCGCGTVTAAPAPVGVTAPGAVRAAADRDRRVPVARAVPVPEPDRSGPGRAARRHVSPGAITGMVTRVAAALGPALDAIRDAVAAAPVAHFDEAGFRVAGKLAWVHSASAGKFALITVHPRRGRQGSRRGAARLRRDSLP
jgi:hypothetical protein